MSAAEILHYTYEDYKRWEGDWELIEGLPVAMSPAPSKRHQRVARELFLQLNQTLHTDTCDTCEILYEIDWKISDNTVVRPDIVLVCDDDSATYLTKAPRLIVEILSPQTARKDETIKFELYEKEGVRYYILVYPDDLKAKIYHINDEGRYVKLGDFTHERFQADTDACNVAIDFAKAFAPFCQTS